MLVYYYADPVRAEAHRRVNNALRTGDLTRPDNCSRCGVACVTRGHHDDYSKPLEVRWLCRKCHGYIHRKENSCSTAI